VDNSSVLKFPQPEIDQQGWPWDDVPSALPELMSNGSSWPKITIVTPSYNQGDYIEETIRSVLFQGYPNLEYIIMDGGSDDESVKVIEKYSAWITHWESKPDRGQSHAINKGFLMSTGDVINWLNSDDILLPGALKVIALAYSQAQDKIMLAEVENRFEDGRPSQIIKQRNVKLVNFINPWNETWSWHQPGAYIPRRLYERTGGLDENLHYVFDGDWMCRLLQIADPQHIYQPIVGFRVHNQAKTTARVPDVYIESEKVSKRYRKLVSGQDERKIDAYFALRNAGVHLGERPEFLSFWDRGKAATYLFRALLAYPRIIFNDDFLRRVRRLLLPVAFMRSSPWTGKQE